MAGGLRVQVQPPSLELGVRVVRVDGLDQQHLEERGGGGSLFLRYYVPAGDGRRRLRVDTRELPCGAGNNDLRWDELARFERWGGGGQQPAAAASPIVFELRWRPSSASGLAAALLGAAGARRARPASRVLARAELPWADVSSAAERWLTLSRVGRELGGGGKAPKLLVEVKAVVHGGDVAGTERRTHGGGGMTGTGCCRAAERCGQCGWVGSEEDMFLAATFS